MRSSRVFLEVCKSEPVWAPRVQALFLMKREGKTSYAAVKRFYKHFNELSKELLAKPAPESFIGRIGKGLKSLARPAKKETLYETNRKRWARIPPQELGKHLNPVRNPGLWVVQNDLEVAFHLHQMQPHLIPLHVLVEFAGTKNEQVLARCPSNWRMVLELAKSGNKDAASAILWAMAGKRFVPKDQDKIFKEMLKIAETGEGTRDNLIITAAKNGNLEAVKALLQNGTITNIFIVLPAVVEATGEAQVDILQEIIQKVPNFKDLREEALRMAVGSGNLIALNELLNLKEISLEEAAKHYELAAFKVRNSADKLPYVAVMNRIEEKYPLVVEASAGEYWCKQLGEIQNGLKSL